MSDPTIRIEARFKNARLFNAIRAATPILSTDVRGQTIQKNGPVATFCRLYSLPYQTVSALLNLRLPPTTRRGKVEGYRPVCLKLAVILGETVEHLFPADLYLHIWRPVAAEVAHEKFLPLSAAGRLPALTDGWDERLDTVAQAHVFRNMLATLTPREEKVIKMRFGFDGPELSLDEVAQEMTVSRERVRQIEAKAFRKLRHPARSRSAAQFLPVNRREAKMIIEHPIGWCMDCNRWVPLPHKGVQPGDIPHAPHCRCLRCAQETAEEFLQRVYAGLPTVLCQRKCGQYCGPVPTAPIERAAMEQAGFPRKMAYDAAVERCTFFDTAKEACRVHSVRPLICRLFGAADDPKMECPHGCPIVGRPKLANAEVIWILNELKRRGQQMEAPEIRWPA